MGRQKGTGVIGWLERNAGKRYKTRNSLIKAAAKKHGCTERSARDSLGRLAKQGRVGKEFDSPNPRSAGGSVKTSKVVKQHKKTLKVPTRFKAGVDVAIVKEEYNDEGRILEGIENLGEQVIKDNDFRQELSIPIDRWRVVSGKEIFSKNKIELRGKQFKGIYWGKEETLDSLRKAVDMI